MSHITGFGWFVIITAVLFLLASIRVFGLAKTVLGVTGLLLFWIFHEDRRRDWS